MATVEASVLGSRTSNASMAPRTLDHVTVGVPFAGAPDFLLGRIGTIARRGETSYVLIGAAAGTDETTVRVQALAELIERCASILPGGHAHVRTAAGDIRSGYREDDPKEDANAPPITLCQGRSIDGSASCVAAGRAHLFWPQRSPQWARARDATGLAAHRDPAAAFWHGLVEVVERDAMIQSWQVPGWPVEALQVPISDTLLAACDSLGLQPRFYDVGWSSLVVIAALADTKLRHVTVGSAAGDEPEGAAAKALTEALVLQATVRTSGEARRLSVSGSDWREHPVASLEHVLAAYERGGVVEWYEAQSEARRNSPARIHRDEEDLVRAVENTIGAICHVALQVPQWAGEGWYACRVIVDAAAERRDGALSKRVRTALARQGLTESEGNRRPHPFG